MREVVCLEVIQILGGRYLLIHWSPPLKRSVKQTLYFRDIDISIPYLMTKLLGITYALELVLVSILIKL